MSNEAKENNAMTNHEKAAISNRYEFVLLYDVKNGNPNGDPSNGNMPRQHADTGYGYATDACIKRKIRDYIDVVKNGEKGFAILFKPDRALNAKFRDAYEENGLPLDKTKKIALGLPSSKTFTTIIEIPTQDEKSMEKIIKYHEDQYIPMPIDDATVDYVILGPSPNDPAVTEVLLSSTASTYAEERMESVESVGFDLIAAEPDAIAMSRALTPPGINDARLIIDYGEDSTDLTVVYNGAPRLVRALPGGLSLLTRTVAGSLNVKESQARQFILKFGLAQDKLEGQVFKALDMPLENFASEITKSVNFFRAKYPNINVGGTLLSGFAGVIPFLGEYIEAKTQIPTSEGLPWQKVRVTQQQQQALSQVAAEFAVAIGLAERENYR